MSTRENKAIVRRFYKETFWGNGDLSVLDDFVAPDFVDRTPVPGLSPDREGLKHVVAMIRSAFADRQGTINHLCQHRIGMGSPALSVKLSGGCSQTIKIVLICA